MRNEEEGRTRKESEITVPEMCLSEISYFMDQVAYFPWKFIPRSKTALAKVPRDGKYPRSESRYSAHKLTSAVTYMRCIVLLEEILGR